MSKIIKKFLICLFLFIFVAIPVFAVEKLNMVVKINQEFNSNQKYEEVQFKTIKRTKILNEIEIPQRSIIRAEVLQSQKERRWHKSGFIICRLKSFETDYPKETVNLEHKNIYFLARKYEKINKKEVAITGTEIVLASAASFFAPGVDVAYFFTKGAIQRKKYPNWFKAGISNVYENSIFWFWIKGKPIDLKEEDKVSLKEVKEEYAKKRKSQIDRKKLKQAKREENKAFKKAIKEAKKADKKAKQEKNKQKKENL